MYEYFYGDCQFRGTKRLDPAQPSLCVASLTKKAIKMFLALPLIYIRNNNEENSMRHMLNTADWA